MRKQDLGGDIISIASKNGLVAGPNNVGLRNCQSFSTAYGKITWLRNWVEIRSG